MSVFNPEGRKPSRSRFLDELNLWIDSSVIEPLGDALEDAVRDGSKDAHTHLEFVRTRIANDLKDKVVQSYKNGFAAGSKKRQQ